jgi:hypothetical protein
LSKIVKIPLKIIAILLGLLLILLAVANTSWFKNYAADKATAWLTKELGVDVSIGEISLDYFDEISATKVYIADLQHDTMIYVENLHVDYDLFSFTNTLIKLDNIALEDAKVFLGIPKDESQINLQFLINYFSPKKKMTRPSAAQVINLSKVSLKNTEFRYFNKNFSPTTDRAFDENDLHFKKISGHLHDFKIINDSLNFVLEDLSGLEKSGLNIQNLSANTIISSSTMRFESLVLQTSKSHIEDFLQFKYSSYADFSEFITDVQIEANFDESKVHTSDLALFSNALKEYTEVLFANGKVTGTIDNLRSEKLQMSMSNHTHFNGKIKITGLPNTAKTYLDINAKILTSTAREIAKLAKLDPAPKEFLALGDIRYMGTFRGYFTDFAVKGDIHTSIGDVATDLTYKQLGTNNAAYAGMLTSPDLDLGKLIGNKTIGTTSFDLQLAGSGLDAHSLNSSISGQIGHISYADYDYKNIVLDGKVALGLYEGDFKIQDPNFNLDFNGSLDISSEIPEIKVRTNVFALNLKTLGLDSQDNILKFNGLVNLTGSELDNITGSIDLDSFTMEKGDSTYRLKDVKLTSEKNANYRQYSLKSDLAVVDLKGNFLLSEVDTLIEHIKHIIYPSQFAKPVLPIKSKNIAAVISIDTFQNVFKELINSAYFESLFLDIEYDHTAGKIESTGGLTNFKYDIVSTPFIDLKISNGGDFTPINFGISTGGLLQNDSILFDQLDANGFIDDGIVNFETTSKRDSILDILLAGKLTYIRDSISVYLDNSKVKIYDKDWTLKRTNFPNIISHHGVVEFRYFDFRNENEILFLDASIGEKADKINVILTDFKLDNLAPFIAGFDIKLAGITNGYIDVSDRQGFPIIESDLIIEDLQLDDDTLGTLTLESINKDNLLAVAIDGSINGGLLNDMKILGSIDFKNIKSPLNLKLTTEKSSIKPFEKYLKGLASNINGLSTTNISITGPLSKPNLRGKMQLDNLDFKVDYLQTNYKGDVTLDIDFNTFKITQATLTDRTNQKGKVSGSINHSNFTDFRFNVNIDELSNFEIMNTSRKDNELFYGTAFVDGNMLISGPMDDILLQINAKSRKGTEIFIPLDNASTSGKLSYVEFVNLKLDNNQLNKTFKSTAGVRMDFNFEITNDANITLIFDELLGDKIEAAGHGNLRMEINTYGDFNMYGGLTIDRGSYLFTALDLITKYFTVKQGGTLFWDGNPYNAKIDLEAIKREYPVPKALVSGIVQDEEELANYSTAIPVDCYLKLTGLLFNPEVAFDLDFPSQSSHSATANNTLNTVIERVKLDQEELNRQVFALLVLGTFIPPSFSAGSTNNVVTAGARQQVEKGAANTGINSLSDFASSQLNNWLGQLDTRLQVGVDYQNSYESEAELILSLKRNFLNDRLEVAYSVDAAAQGSRPYDVSVKYDINKEGNVKIRGFQKQANDPTLGNINNVTTTGVGLSFRYQFDRFRLRKKKVKPKEDTKLP